MHGGTGVLQCIDVYGRNVLMEQKEPGGRIRAAFFRIPEEAKGIALADPYLYQSGRTVGGREKRGGNNAGGGGILL